MATVRVVYTRVCVRFLEPNGLQSGIFTDQDFLNHFAGTIGDFFERTGFSKMIATGAIHFYIPTYQVPDQISHVDNVFVAGRILRRTNLQSLGTEIFEWRKKSGIPTQFHEDGLPSKQVEIYPNPNYEGSAIPTSGPGVIQLPENDEYMVIGDFYPSLRGYSLVGSAVPVDNSLAVKTTWTLDDQIPDIPNSAIQYLAWGVLAKMFSDDSEAKDEARARYCAARFEEGVEIFRSILAERCLNEPDNSQ